MFCLGGSREGSVDNSVLWALLLVTMAPHRCQQRAEQGYREVQHPLPCSSSCCCVVSTHLPGGSSRQEPQTWQFPFSHQQCWRCILSSSLPSLPTCLHALFAFCFPVFAYISIHIKAQIIWGIRILQPVCRDFCPTKKKALWEKGEQKNSV